MSRSASIRLMNEYKEMKLNSIEGIVANPVSEDNMLEWDVQITGPQGTCFEGGKFPAKLTFPSTYPFNPPTMHFTCEMFHPNIQKDGEVCICVLDSPHNDLVDNDNPFETWNPVLTIEKILLFVLSILDEPKIESPANFDAAKLWMEDREEYNLFTKILSGYFSCNKKT